MRNQLNLLGQELKHHAPFTLLGALTGIVCMLLFRNANSEVNHILFQVFHPAHVLLSAVVTASLYRLRSSKNSLLAIALVGYIGSIGVATLSDCIVPYLGEEILGVMVPTHASLHEVGESHAEDELDAHENGDHEGHDHAEEALSDNHVNHDHEEALVDDHHEHHHGSGLHLGFIEDWYIVNPAALLGILLAFFIPHAKLHTAMPHAAHVLVSTWASSFHVLMNTEGPFTPILLLGFLIVLFIAVWLPCCISDIVFPLLFVGPEHVPTCCHGHPKSKESHGKDN